MAFRIGLAQCCHPADGDVVGMVDAWAACAAGRGVDLLVFPESLMTPFELTGADFAGAAEPLDAAFGEAVGSIARKRGLWLLYTANEFNPAHPELPYNTAVLVDDAGQRQAAYRKTHLFDTDFVRESDKVAAGDEPSAPCETPFGRIGMGICYDVRFPEMARKLAVEGCDVLVYPAAWVDGPRKAEQWRALLKARAIENELYVAGVSRCDRGFGSTQRDYAGNSCVFGPLGEEVALAQGTDEELVVADLDLSALDRARAAMPVLDHRRPELY